MTETLVERLTRVRNRIHPTNRRPDLRMQPKLTFGEIEQIIEAATRIQTLEAGIKTIAEGNEPRPLGKAWRADGQASKNDKCIHDRWMYEDCGNCVAEFAASLLPLPPEGSKE